MSNFCLMKNKKVTILPNHLKFRYDKIRVCLQNSSTIIWIIIVSPHNFIYLIFSYFVSQTLYIMCCINENAIFALFFLSKNTFDCICITILHMNFLILFCMNVYSEHSGTSEDGNIELSVFWLSYWLLIHQCHLNTMNNRNASTIFGWTVCKPPVSWIY